MCMCICECMCVHACSMLNAGVHGTSIMHMYARVCVHVSSICIYLCVYVYMLVINM